MNCSHSSSYFSTITCSCHNNANKCHLLFVIAVYMHVASNCNITGEVLLKFSRNEVMPYLIWWQTSSYPDFYPNCSVTQTPRVEVLSKFSLMETKHMETQALYWRISRSFRKSLNFITCLDHECIRYHWEISYTHALMF